MTDLALDLLHREIRAQRNRLMNAIICRRDHPSYGYTKKGILEDLAVLEGMLYASYLLRTGESTGLRLLATRKEAELVLGEDIDRLRKRAEEA